RDARERAYRDVLAAVLESAIGARPRGRAVIDRRVRRQAKDDPAPTEGLTLNRIGFDAERRRLGAEPVSRYRMNPKLSSFPMIRCAARSGVSCVVSMRISGSSGASYGSSIPVNPLMIPARAFA